MAKLLETKEFKFNLSEFDDAAGTFVGYGNVFDVEDSYGDTMKKGAFARTIDAWKAADAPLPMLFQHDMYQPIGGYRDLSEDGKGLRAKGSLLLDIERARDTYHLLKAKVIRKLSIGFSTEDFEAVKDEKGKVIPFKRNLTEVRLWELSPVLWAACDPAVIDGVKMDNVIREMRKGNVKEVDIKAAIKALEALLVGSSTSTDEVQGDLNTHEETAGSGDHPAGVVTVDSELVRSLTDLQKRVLTK